MCPISYYVVVSGGSVMPCHPHLSGGYEVHENTASEGTLGLMSAHNGKKENIYFMYVVQE